MNWLEFENIKIDENEIIAYEFHPGTQVKQGRFADNLNIYLRGGGVINIKGDEAVKFWESKNKNSDSTYESGGAG